MVFSLTSTARPGGKSYDEGRFSENVAKAGALARKPQRLRWIHILNHWSIDKKRKTVPSSGIWYLHRAWTKAREGRNPQTGATIHIKASRTVGFKPAPSL